MNALREQLNEARKELQQFKVRTAASDAPGPLLVGGIDLTQLKLLEQQDIEQEESIASLVSQYKYSSDPLAVATVLVGS